VLQSSRTKENHVLFCEKKKKKKSKKKKKKKREDSFFIHLEGRQGIHPNKWGKPKLWNKTN